MEGVDQDLPAAGRMPHEEVSREPDSFDGKACPARDIDVDHREADGDASFSIEDIVEVGVPGVEVLRVVARKALFSE